MADPPRSCTRGISKSEYSEWEKDVIRAFYQPGPLCTDLLPQKGKPSVVLKRKVILYVLEADGKSAEMVAACSSELPSKRSLTMFHLGSQSLASVSHGLKGDVFAHPACDLGGLTNYKQMLGKEAEYQGAAIKISKTSHLADCTRIVLKQWRELARKDFPDSLESDLKAWLVSALVAFEADIEVRMVVLPEEHRVVATVDDVREKTGRYYTRIFDGPAESYAKEYHGSALLCGITETYITPNLNMDNMSMEYHVYAGVPA